MKQSRAIAARDDSTNYEVLYNFSSSPDGETPAANLINVGGTLYGTTLAGGKRGWGTVFTITLRGREKVLYSFKRVSTGSQPEAGLIDVGGTLYGTTNKGGSDSCRDSPSYYPPCGTVFSVTPSGEEKVLHRFGGGNDGSRPAAGLVDVGGTLYGTTVHGGAYDYHQCGGGCGTVFSITPSGTEKVLYSFGRGADGAQPKASLVEVKGVLYGTTTSGGAYCGGSSIYGCGTVFSITPDGTEKVLHSFGYDSDGWRPVGGLIYVKGTLYGTTALGPGKCNRVGFCGTVFSITPNGAEKVLHGFSGHADGGYPEASLIEVKGTLYGTTTDGGPYGCGGDGCGTVFSITPSGTEKVLHGFGGQYKSDGAYPTAPLVDVKSKLYGTTYVGGTYSRCPAGCGTVFALTP
jgi:uncharacterized repeat protein (TIGR03803 family)